MKDKKNLEHNILFMEVLKSEKTISPPYPCTKSLIHFASLYKTFKKQRKSRRCSSVGLFHLVAHFVTSVLPL